MLTKRIELKQPISIINVFKTEYYLTDSKRYNKMKNIAAVVLIFLIFGINIQAQRQNKTFTAMFYNVENLFDIVDDPETEDEEFTPDSPKKWDAEKYEKKLEDISRVILSIPEKELPAIIGFAEVENESVLNDLISQRGLKRGEYKAILVDGNDPRGIDCGLIYRPELFKYKSHELIPVEDLSGKEYPLRGILHVLGDGPDGKPIHIYINHWKSRYGGVKETEHLRIYQAIALRRQLDQLLSSESEPRVIIMGDFNDEPTNRSVSEILHSGNKRKNPWLNDAYNLFYDLHNLDIDGSYNYQGIWQMYDQIIISYSLINQNKGLTTNFEGGKVLKEEWMLFHDEKKDIKVPNRTYGGNNYYGGISDHFPVYVTFSW